MSDVPLGVFLSGGLDSSSVAAMMAQAGATDVSTFSVGFEEASFDESTFARRVAGHLGTDHHERTFSATDMLELVPSVAEWFDEPVADPSVLPTYLLSSFAREHVTVALGGDGGDELFAGYPTYDAHRLYRSWDRIPRVLRRHVIAPMVDRLPASDANFGLAFKAQRFVSGDGLPLHRRHATWMSGLRPDRALGLLSPRVREELADHDVLGVADERALSCGSDDWVDQVRHQDLTRYLRDVVLVKVDRASMAASLEVRAPLLDHHLFEWAAGLPTEYVYGQGTTKRLLKDAIRPLLPDGIVDRPKKGFGVPLASWLRGPLRSMAEDLLAEERLGREGLFEPAGVSRLLREHVAGRYDHRKELWPLLTFQLWRERWIDGTGSRSDAPVS